MEREIVQFRRGILNIKKPFKMYGKLPDYGEFQGYDLGIDSELFQIDGGDLHQFPQTVVGIVEAPFIRGVNSEEITATNKNSSGE